MLKEEKREEDMRRRRRRKEIACHYSRKLENINLVGSIRKVTMK
jgi:hypothetical protein